jgi:hypothetical protein
VSTEKRFESFLRFQRKSEGREFRSVVIAVNVSGFFQELDLLEISSTRLTREEVELHYHPLAKIHPPIETLAEASGHLLAIGQAPSKRQDENPF